MNFQTATAEFVNRALDVDRVVLVILGLLGVLAVSTTEQAVRSIEFVGTALLDIGPFLILSVLAAAIAKATGLDKRIAVASAGRRSMRAVAIAAAFGALSPFCSCGVVPLIAALLAAGVPLAPVVAFWLASPLMDPQMFLLMLPVFGISFTAAKVSAAFGIGLFAGLATHFLADRGMFANPLRPGVSTSCCGASRTLAVTPVVWRFWRDLERTRMFFDESRAIGSFLFKWLTLAFLLESLMIAWIPADMIGTWLGGGSWWVLPAAVVVGVPTYLNGYAAIPTVGALLDMGMAPGAAMAFMLAGGVTSIPAAMAVFALVKRPVFLWYVAWGLCGSLAAAVLLQLWSAISG